MTTPLHRRGLLPDDAPDSLWRAVVRDDNEPGRYVWDDPADVYMARCPQCGRTLIAWPILEIVWLDGFTIRPHLRQDLSPCNGSGQIVGAGEAVPLQ